MSKSPGQQTREQEEIRPARIDVSEKTLSKMGVLPLVVRLTQVQMRRTSSCCKSVKGTESNVGEVANSPLLSIYHGMMPRLRCAEDKGSCSFHETEEAIVEVRLQPRG